MAAAPGVLPYLVEQDAFGLARHDGLGRVHDQLQNAGLIVLLGQLEREQEHPPEGGELPAFEVPASRHGYSREANTVPGSMRYGGGLRGAEAMQGRRHFGQQWRHSHSF